MVRVSSPSNFRSQMANLVIGLTHRRVPLIPQTRTTSLRDSLRSCNHVPYTLHEIEISVLRCIAVLGPEHIEFRCFH